MCNFCLNIHTRQQLSFLPTTNLTNHNRLGSENSRHIPLIFNFHTWLTVSILSNIASLFILSAYLFPLIIIIEVAMSIYHIHTLHIMKNIYIVSSDAKCNAKTTTDMENVDLNCETKNWLKWNTNSSSWWCFFFVSEIRAFWLLWKFCQGYLWCAFRKKVEVDLLMILWYFKEKYWRKIVYLIFFL